MKTILQIVPKTPGPFDGVGDYALIVAKKLYQAFGYNTVFVAAELDSAAAANPFEVTPLDHLVDKEEVGPAYDHAILHYVNYGYQKRGVPLRLLPILRELRRSLSGRLLTIFHELYASGPPWKSEFWLRPVQIRIAKSIFHVSDACIVSSEVLLAELQQLVADARAHVHPVPSNFGEPLLSPEQIAGRDPHRWAICGGTALVERSLHSFRAIVKRIPEAFAPRELFVLGGNDNPATRNLLEDLVRHGTDSPWRAGVRCDYRPRIAAAEASQILGTCSFAWLDYFNRPGVPTAVVLKSTAFAAACAHGVITILPDEGSPVSVEADLLPGPYFVDPRRSRLPENRARTASEIYSWYQRRASSEKLVRGVGDALGIS